MTRSIDGKRITDINTDELQKLKLHWQELKPHIPNDGATPEGILNEFRHYRGHGLEKYPATQFLVGMQKAVGEAWAEFWKLYQSPGFKSDAELQNEAAQLRQEALRQAERIGDTS